MEYLRAGMSGRRYVVVACFALAGGIAGGCSSSGERDVAACDCATGANCEGGGCPGDCEADTAAIVGSLGAGVSVVQSFCLELGDGPIGARLRDDGSLELLHARVTTEGRDSTVVLEEYLASVESGAVTAAASCETAFSADSDDVTVWLTRDLAVSADGRSAAWGLRGMIQEGDSRIDVDGAWFLANREACSIEANTFPRVEGVAFVSEGRAPRVLVSGGLGGPVYMDGVFGDDGARALAESTPGSIWRVGDAVIVGGVLGHGVAPATLIPLSSLRDGREVQVGEDGVVSGDAGTSRFVAVEGRGIVTDAPWSGVGRPGLELRSLDVRADGLVFGDAVPLAGPEALGAAPVIGSRRYLLRHARGLLLVE